MVMYMFAGALQLASSAERLHQRVDPDASRHQGRALHRFARVRPALQVGPGQEGPRGAQENLSQSHSNPAQHTAKIRLQIPSDCSIFCSIFFLSFHFSSLTASVVQDSGRRSPRRGGGHLSFALPPFRLREKKVAAPCRQQNIWTGHKGGWNFQPILFALLVFLDIQIKRDAFPK
jgi:hypothetical protein